MSLHVALCPPEVLRLWCTDFESTNIFCSVSTKTTHGTLLQCPVIEGVTYGVITSVYKHPFKGSFSWHRKRKQLVSSIHFWRRGIILYMSLNHSINMFKRGSSFQSLEKLQSKAGTWLSSQLWLDGALAGRALLEEKFCMELPDTSSTWGQHLQLFLVIRNELLLGVLGKLPRAQTGDAPLPWALVPLASVQNSSNVWL